jgi:hypothetical protein
VVKSTSPKRYFVSSKEFAPGALLDGLAVFESAARPRPALAVGPAHHQHATLWRAGYDACGAYGFRLVGSTGSIITSLVRAARAGGGMLSTVSSARPAGVTGRAFGTKRGDGRRHCKLPKGMPNEAEMAVIEQMKAMPRDFRRPDTRLAGPDARHVRLHLGQRPRRRQPDRQGLHRPRACDLGNDAARFRRARLRGLSRNP